jgi:hypothetical protein
MKTVSIRELHERTGALVREAALSPLRITDRGRVVAILQPPGATIRDGIPLPDREAWIATLPKQTIESTSVVSEDRDR